MDQLLSIMLLHAFLLSCNNDPGSSSALINRERSAEINPYQQIKAIPLPTGFKRVADDHPVSFTSYLRSIRLKEQTTVHLYNGQPKQNQTAQYAVLNISVENKDLQQCADAVMRLRAEYLFAQNQFDQILFYDNDKTAYRFSTPHTRAHFDKYLNKVFGMCGSASLSKQLKPVGNFPGIKPGDVIIRGGFPGHAVMVMDVAVNASGEKIYLLAQSYMPAQDIHVLVNPMNTDLSPWYEVNHDNHIHTPEYSFTKNELKRW
jgi:maltoporin